jgi:hypothetical protein
MKKIERQLCQWHETMETPAECSMKPTTEKWTHTKTPWKVADQKEYIYANDRTLVTKTLTIDCHFMEAQANAAFIVRAVNSHHELLSNLKKLIEEFGDVGITDSNWMAVQTARKAIAKAD